MELAAPLRGRLAQPFNADAAGQATLDGGLDQIRGKEGERDRHVDLTDAAAFTRRDLVDASDRTGDNFGEPAPAARNRGHKPGAALGAFRPHCIA